VDLFDPGFAKSHNRYQNDTFVVFTLLILFGIMVFRRLRGLVVRQLFLVVKYDYDSGVFSVDSDVADEVFPDGPIWVSDGLDSCWDLDGYDDGVGEIRAVLEGLLAGDSGYVRVE
jgi:hypothetical protein